MEFNEKSWQMEILYFKYLKCKWNFRARRILACMHAQSLSCIWLFAAPDFPVLHGVLFIVKFYLFYNIQQQKTYWNIKHVDLISWNVLGLFSILEPLFYLWVLGFAYVRYFQSHLSLILHFVRFCECVYAHFKTWQVYVFRWKN